MWNTSIGGTPTVELLVEQYQHAVELDAALVVRSWAGWHLRAAVRLRDGALQAEYGRSPRS